MTSDGEEQVINAVLHHFATQSQDCPNEALLYFVTGKAVSITDHTPVGEGHDPFDYDLEINVLVVSVCISKFFKH